MKYRYRNTNTIVESGIALDSAIFTPLVEQKEKAEEEAPKEEKKATRRKRG